MKIKKNDKVMVIAGKDKGKTGTVSRISKERPRNRDRLKYAQETSTSAKGRGERTDYRQSYAYSHFKCYGYGSRHQKGGSCR